MLIESSDGTSEWGTVGVNDNIVEASLQALVDSLEYALVKDTPVALAASVTGVTMTGVRRLWGGVVSDSGVEAGPRHARRGPRAPLRLRADLPVSRAARFSGEQLFNPYQHADRRLAARQPARARARLAAASPAASSRTTKSSRATRASVTRSPACPTTSRSPRMRASTRSPRTSTATTSASTTSWRSARGRSTGSTFPSGSRAATCSSSSTASPRPPTSSRSSIPSRGTRTTMPTCSELTGYHLIEVVNGPFPARRRLGCGALERPRGVGHRQRRQPRSREPRAARRRLDDDRRTVGKHAGRRRRAQDGPLVRGGAHQRGGRETRCSTARRSPIAR